MSQNTGSAACTDAIGNGVSRRTFVRTVAAGATIVPFAANALATGVPPQDYSLLLLGDTHFDRLDHHDFDWMHAHFAKDISQVNGYCKHTQNVLPDLLKHASARLKATSSPPAYTLHVGDLVEGICGSERLATQHVSEAWDFFKAALPWKSVSLTKLLNTNA